MTLDARQVRERLRYNWVYMGGVLRSTTQVKSTGEVFTPSTLAQEMVENFPDEFVAEMTFRDTSCGDGQLLSEIIIRKVELGVPFEKAITQIQGCDIMASNVYQCRKRLSGGILSHEKTLENYVIIGNSLDCLSMDVLQQTELDKLKMIELFGGEFEALVEKINTPE